MAGRRTGHDRQTLVYQDGALIVGDLVVRVVGQEREGGAESGPADLGADVAGRLFPRERPGDGQPESDGRVEVGAAVFGRADRPISVRSSLAMPGDWRARSRPWPGSWPGTGSHLK